MRMENISTRNSKRIPISRRNVQHYQPLQRRPTGLIGPPGKARPKFPKLAIQTITQTHCPPAITLTLCSRRHWRSVVYSGPPIRVERAFKQAYIASDTFVVFLQAPKSALQYERLSSQSKADDGRKWMSDNCCDGPHRWALCGTERWHRRPRGENNNLHEHTTWAIGSGQLTFTGLVHSIAAIKINIF